MITLRQITPEEYEADIRQELKEVGLISAIEKRFDNINEVCSCMRYADHRYVQEMLNDVIELLYWHKNEEET